MTQRLSVKPVPTPSSASDFVETWLPSRFHTFLTSSSGAALTLNAECSIFLQIGADSWLLALAQGQLKVSPTAPDKAQATFRLHISPEAFERFVLREIPNLPESSPELPTSLPALKLLSLDAEAIALVQNVPGCLRVMITDGEMIHSAAFGPANHPPEPAACTLTCAMSDVEAMRAGTAQPMELFFGGKIQLEGDAQVAMALAGLFL